MKAKMLTPGKCLLLHRWREVVDTGFTVYTECKDCKSRKVRQREGGYQPVNIEWLCGLATNEQLRSNTGGKPPRETRSA